MPRLLEDGGKTARSHRRIGQSCVGLASSSQIVFAPFLGHPPEMRSRIDWNSRRGLALTAILFPLLAVYLMAFAAYQIALAGWLELRARLDT